MNQYSRRQFLMASGAIALAPRLALAATEWPKKPIHLVVAFAPGGSLDLIARRLAAYMESQLGVPVVVENRSGAGGRIGTQYVARAPGDGYTLIATSSACHGVAPALYPEKELGYEPMQNFTHIGLISKGPMALIVKGDAPYGNAAEFVKFVQESGKPVFYGSGGIGSLGHLTGALLGDALGVPMQHVSYRGSAPAQADLLAGNITAVCDNLSSHAAQYRAGALKVIGLTASERFPTLPDVATFPEQGYQDLVASAWYGLSGSGGIPAGVAARIHQTLSEFLSDPEMSDLLASMIMVADPAMSSADYSEFVRTDIDKWSQVVKDSAITVT